MTNEKGDVVSTTLLNKGHPLLIRAAEDNVHEWKFASKAGDDSPTVVKYFFVLEKSSADYPKTKFPYEVPNRVYVETQRMNITE